MCNRPTGVGTGVEPKCLTAVGKFLLEAHYRAANKLSLLMFSHSFTTLLVFHAHKKGDLLAILCCGGPK